MVTARTSSPPDAGEKAPLIGLPLTATDKKRKQTGIPVERRPVLGLVRERERKRESAPETFVKQRHRSIGKPRCRTPHELTKDSVGA